MPVFHAVTIAVFARVSNAAGGCAFRVKAKEIFILVFDTIGVGITVPAVDTAATVDQAPVDLEADCGDETILDLPTIGKIIAIGVDVKGVGRVLVFGEVGETVGVWVAGGVGSILPIQLALKFVALVFVGPLE